MRGRSATGVFMLLAGIFCSAAAAFTPYAADDATLHLWHLDEPRPPFLDSGRSPVALQGLLNGASAGSGALDAFDASVCFNWKPGDEGGSTHPYGPILLAKPELDSGNGDNVDEPFPIMGKDGAFTMEAIVKLDVLPSASSGYAADIVTMDDEGRDNRVFLFRIEKPGFLSFVPISGDAVRGGGLATIPTSGPNAINTHDWFHVAVTYDGNENVSDNLKLYWTRLGAGAEEANLIGRGTLSADLRRQLGDFAIGNSGKINPLGPFEFFPGCIDEVRISSIARSPYDFFFVSPEARKRAAEQVPANPPRASKSGLALQRVLMDNVPVPPTFDGEPMVLGPGMHRLDFDFGFPPGVTADPLAVKCRLEGLDDEWHPTARGMTLTWEMLAASGELLGSTTFSATRSSPGWESDVVDSPLVRRTEPLFVPEQTRSIRVTMSSGTPDTTGCWVIDDLSLSRSANPGVNLWPNGGFDQGERTDQIGGIPAGWKRGGSEPAIARLMLAEAPALGLLDAEQNHSAFWTCTQPLASRPPKGGETFLLTWSEAFNVISGASLHATYMNVPSGQYKFRAIAVSGNPVTGTTDLALPIIIRQPYWKQVWFIPLLVAGGVVLVGLSLFRNYQRRSRSRIATIKMSNALERDRARIARDMHDDLGTRVSLLKHAASVVRQAIDRDPGNAKAQAVRLESAASDLVWAMDGLVWAVNPANDTLEHLAGHLSGMAQEIFRDAPVRLRMSIPMDLPALSLRSDFRHHFSLVVKEALHNILKHSGPCEASLQFTLEDRTLVAVVTDTGAGFDPSNPKAGNGLLNLLARTGEMNGTCEIKSAPGQGTKIVLRCPLPKVSLPLKS
jgi:signal transduction histidine kinase